MRHHDDLVQSFIGENIAEGRRHAAQDDLRAQYERFCADLKRHLPPVEAGFNGAPTFTEWKEVYGYA